MGEDILDGVVAYEATKMIIDLEDILWFYLEVLWEQEVERWVAVILRAECLIDPPTEERSTSQVELWSRKQNEVLILVIQNGFLKVEPVDSEQIIDDEPEWDFQSVEEGSQDCHDWLL